MIRYLGESKYCNLSSRSRKWLPLRIPKRPVLLQDGEMNPRPLEADTFTARKQIWLEERKDMSRLETRDVETEKVNKDKIRKTDLVYT